MKLYIAGAFWNGTADRKGRLYSELMNDAERRIVDTIPHQLESFHYVGRPEKVQQMRDAKVKVFMDSGAYSAFTLGKPINLPDYCRYIHENGDIIEILSVLDSINDALTTYQNQMAMERDGIAALPCFHFGEDERYLEHYVANYPYITLGGMGFRSGVENKAWLDYLWPKYLCNPDGTAKLKVHGFAMNRIDLMQRYPWFSVDASTWLREGMKGNVFLSMPDDGVLTWPVSTKSPDRHKWNQHIATLAPPQRQWLADYIESHGFTIERLSTVYISRWVLNIQTFGIINDKLNRNPPRFEVGQVALF